MFSVTTLLDEIKASPYEEIVIKAPHTGHIKFATLQEGSKVQGPQGIWKEKPGSLLLTIEREHNLKNICAPEKGEVCSINKELEGKFVESGTPLLTVRHYLTKNEVQQKILKQALHLFVAPERAKYYFTPEVDKKIRASNSQAISVSEGMELFIMSRMKRETPLYYSGPKGVIYAVYFNHTENVDAGQALIGVCPPDQLESIEKVVLRIQTEWREG